MSKDINSFSKRSKLGDSNSDGLRIAMADTDLDGFDAGLLCCYFCIAEEL